MITTVRETSQRVLLAGSSPLYTELRNLLEEKGFTVVALPEAADKPIAFALEVTNHDLEQKKALIQQLDQLLPPQVPLVATSLAVSATAIASWTVHPQRVVGFGTLAPLAERNLIELAPALQTDKGMVQKAEELFQSLGKETAVVDDETGLVFPRILSLIINEAAFALMEKAATPEDIDTAMRLGTNYPHGPLEWADEIGLDEVYAILRGLQRDLGEERYRPAPLIRKMVQAGWLGKRSGRGFFTYQ